jgi:hypothetical protein
MLPHTTCVAVAAAVDGGVNNGVKGHLDIFKAQRDADATFRARYPLLFAACKRMTNRHQPNNLGRSD